MAAWNSSSTSSLVQTRLTPLFRWVCGGRSAKRTCFDLNFVVRVDVGGEGGGVGGKEERKEVGVLG